MNLIKLVVAAGTVVMSVGAWGQPIDCAIFVNGKRLSQARSVDSQIFRGENFEFTAQPVAHNAKRVKVTIQSSGSEREGYLIGAFRNGRLNMSPEINGQSVTVTCRE